MRVATAQAGDAEPPSYRPFLKWAGGKTQLLPQLLAHVPDHLSGYWEPFVGGGALFFALAPRLKGYQVILSDVNEQLIRTYRAVRDRPDDVLTFLKAMPRTKEFFYTARKHFNNVLCGAAEHAALFIYLNKSAYNGLWRVNSSGHFNVPFGDYKGSVLTGELKQTILSCSEALQGVHLAPVDFNEVKIYQRDWFIYADPPYAPLSATSSFTSYAKRGFDANEQVRLRDAARCWRVAGANVLLSNSSASLIRDLYSDFTVSEVDARRAINSNGAKRGVVKELLIRGY